MASKSLGTLTLDLVAKIGGFTAPMDQAERKARKASAGIRDSANEASSAWGNLGAVAAGAFAGLSIAGLFTRFISETQAAEQEQAQLAAVLRSTGEAAGFNRDQLNAMADAMETASTFSGGDINQAQTALLAFTGVVGDEFPRALQAAIDMAARTGSTVQQAAETIGRALDIPSKGLTALSKQGFRFTAEQKALAEQLEATGRTAEAQGIILQALEESYGGAAAAARDTFGGALMALQNTVSGLLTGEGSLGLATDAVNTLNDALSSPAGRAGIDALAASAVVLGTVMLGRVAGSATASAVAFALAQKEAIRYQMALASMAGVSTRAAVGITAVGVAARGASAAMALLGGPVGVAVLAASALLYFATSAGDSKDEASALREEVDYLNASFDGFTKNQAKAALLDIQQQFTDAQLRALDAGEAISRYERLLRDLPGDARVQEWSEALVRARGEFDSAGQVVDALRGKIQQLNEVVANADVSGAAKAVSKTYKDLASRIEEQILLHGLNTDAAKLEARISAGLIDGLLEGEGARLIALQKTRDAQTAESESQKKRAEAAKSAANAAAQAAKAAEQRSASEAKAIQQSIDGLQRQALQVGWTTDAIELYDLRTRGASEAQLLHARTALATVDAFEKQKKAQEDYQGLVANLRTDEEQRTETLRAQLAVIEAMGEAADKTQVGRAVAGAFEAAPEFAGVENMSGGALGEFAKYDDAEKELEDWYATQLEMLRQLREEKLDANAEFDEQELVLKQQHEAALAAIERSRMLTGLQATGDFLGQLTALRDTDSKKGRAVAKTAAIAQATINAYTAATGAYASASAIPVAGWVLGPIAAAAALAAGLANVSAIKGQAHDGIMSVPSSGTWNLEKGERVTTANTSAALDKVLADIQAGQRTGADTGRSRGNVTVNQTNNFRQADSRTANQSATAAGRKLRQAQARLGG